MDYLTLTPPDHDDDCGWVDPNFTKLMENQLIDNQEEEEEEEDDDDTGAQLESALGRRWTNNDSQRVVWRMDREIHALGPDYFAHYRAHFVDMVADPDFGHVWERAICRYINDLRAQGSLGPDTDTDFLVSDIWSEVGRYIDTGAVDVTIDTGAIDDDHIVVGSSVSEEALSRGLKRKRGSGEMCVVCQDLLGEGEQVAGLGCGHNYHVDCIKQWLREKNVCPLCKVRAVQEEDDGDA